ncbi:hypothetical protein AVEN_177467-1 [Araneus ventricosus]|uniref:Uncharacterized protein n=1 Tax=Araneus ventricosus TaxID=182803 RepID=A0A4Y2F5A6_ARAVE|nr:hypothetical protein AVEN_126036-1 [Araneus ventricosus]GBM35981.1 hypothetical protein AVEN_177467-1 [Araneus ventricosus]
MFLLLLSGPFNEIIVTISTNKPFTDLKKIIKNEGVDIGVLLEKAGFKVTCPASGNRWRYDRLSKISNGPPVYEDLWSRMQCFANHEIFTSTYSSSPSERRTDFKMIKRSSN